MKKLVREVYKGELQSDRNATKTKFHKCPFISLIKGYLGSPGMTVAFRYSWTQKLDDVTLPLVLCVFFSATNDKPSLYDGKHDCQEP